MDAEVDAQVRELTGLSVEQLIEVEGFPDDSDSVVYLSGSWVSGHANPWSDIDVFVVSDREPIGANPMVASTNIVVPHFVEGRRVDYEFWLPSKLDELADRLAAHQLATGESIQGATFIQIEEIFIHRLRIGIPLVNPEGFARCQARFDFAKLAAFQTEEAIRHLDSELEDIIGMRKGGDRETALWVARQVVDVAVEAYLHSLGITDPVAKWRVRYLREIEDTPRHRQLRDDYWRLSYPDTAEVMRSDERWERHVEEVIAFANQLTVWIQG